MSQATIELKAREYKAEVKSLEEIVKDWLETKVKEVSELSEKCYDTFNEFQMELVKLKKSDVPNYRK